MALKRIRDMIIFSLTDAFLSILKNTWCSSGSIYKDFRCIKVLKKSYEKWSKKSTKSWHENIFLTLENYMTYLIDKLKRITDWDSPFLFFPFSCLPLDSWNLCFCFLKSYSILFTSGSCLHHKTHVYLHWFFKYANIYILLLTREYLHSFLYFLSPPVPSCCYFPEFYF